MRQSSSHSARFSRYPSISTRPASSAPPAEPGAARGPPPTVGVWLVAGKGADAAVSSAHSRPLHSGVTASVLRDEVACDACARWEERGESARRAAEGRAGCGGAGGGGAVRPARRRLAPAARRAAGRGCSRWWRPCQRGPVGEGTQVASVGGGGGWAEGRGRRAACCGAPARPGRGAAGSPRPPGVSSAREAPPRGPPPRAWAAGSWGRARARQRTRTRGRPPRGPASSWPREEAAGEGRRKIGQAVAEGQAGGAGGRGGREGRAAPVAALPSTRSWLRCAAWAGAAPSAGPAAGGTPGCPPTHRRTARALARRPSRETSRGLSTWDRRGERSTKARVSETGRGGAASYRCIVGGGVTSQVA